MDLPHKCDEPKRVADRQEGRCTHIRLTREHRMCEQIATRFLLKPVEGREQDLCVEAVLEPTAKPDHRQQVTQVTNVLLRRLEHGEGRILENLADHLLHMFDDGVLLVVFRRKENEHFDQ